MHATLSFEQAPPISAPFRFFVTAPWFAAAAGALLLVEGADLLVSRWVPATLAATHLIVLGFMLQVMCGALLQFIPVAMGGNVWRPRRLAALTHASLSTGTLLLVGGFLGFGNGLLIAAAVLIGAGMSVFLLAVGLSLWRTTTTSPSVIALRLAHLSLAVTLLIGIALASALATGQPWALPALTNVHASWGLLGWGLTLLVGVSYFVVPMFQLTPPYPSWLTRSLTPALLLLLLVWSALFPDFASPWQEGVLLAGLGLAGVFAGVTLNLQQRRRRKLKDSTFWFFRVAMLSLLGVGLSTVFMLAFPEVINSDRLTVWTGLLVLVGTFGSAINGMLYKIMPFINWLHLQQHYSQHGRLPPTMDKMLPERRMRLQFRAHIVALLVLLAAVWLPLLARPAGVLLLIDAAWLGSNLIAIARAYRRHRAALPPLPPAATCSTPS